MSFPLWEQFVHLIEQGLLLINMGIGGHPAIAIILFTAIIKAAMFPLTMKQLHSSKEMQLLQPKIKELQKKYAKDRQKLTEETMKLYKEHKVNPAAGCLPMLIQLPIFFGLYSAIINLSHADFGVSFLWLPSLASPDPLFILPVLAMVTQFIQQRMMMPSGGAKDSQAQMMNQMMQFMPVMILIFAWNFASGAVIYWVASTVFGIVQQYFVTGWGSLPELPLLRNIWPGEPANNSNSRQLEPASPRTVAVSSASGGDGSEAPARPEGGLLGLLTKMTGFTPPATETEGSEASQANVENNGQGEEKALRSVYEQAGRRPPRRRRSKK